MKAKTYKERIDFQIKKLNLLKDNFEDENVYKMWTSFIYEIATDYNISNSKKIRVLSEYIKDVENWYDVEFKNIKWENIRFLALNKKIVWSKFNYLLKYIIKNNYIENTFFNEEMLEYLEGHYNAETFVNIYEKEKPDNWFVYSADNYSKAIYINGNKFMIELLNEFIILSKRVRAIEFVNGIFYEKFYESFLNDKLASSINNIENFSCKTFEIQFDYYLNNGTKKDLSLLTNFYIFLHQKNNNLFKKTDSIDYYLLLRANFITEYISGARKILYNPFDDVPNIDKWILDFNGFNITGNKINDETRMIIDFSVINDTNYRKITKEWFWKSESNIQGKLSTFHYIKHFFNHISDLKSKKRLSFYIGNKDISNVYKISTSEVMDYKFFVNEKYKSKIAQNSAILSARAILEYLQDNDLIEVEKTCFYYLKSKPYKSNNTAKAIPDNELKLLSEIMKKKAEESYTDKLNYAIFYIGLETEFRISHVLNLTVDCVKETFKPNEYVIKTKTKTSKGRELEQPITIYTKQHIDRIIEITKEVRSQCLDNDIKKYLFISYTNRKNIFSKHKEKTFNNFLKECCEELNIEQYTFSNLRDTHITKAEEFKIRNNLSDSAQKILTGHRYIDTDDKHYIEKKIVEMLELVHSTIIGDIDVNGKVDYKKPGIELEENLVSNKCGYCSNSFCNEFSYLDCLMCKSFVTTVNRIPYFEEMIKVMDEKIKSATIVHDKEDFMNIKQLLLNYLKRLYLKKEETECQKQ